MLRQAKLLSAAALLVATPNQALLAEPIDVQSLTVEDIAEGYETGAFTAVELTQAYIDQILAYNDVYNAWITFDFAGALARAAEIDAMMDEVTDKPALWGVPIAIKDPMDVAGLRTTAGSTAFAAEFGGVEIIPDTDAPLVARIRDAGAIILGKTNIPDFSRTGTHSTSSVAGATHNAYDITRVPGGSSGGSGVAVATGMAPVAMAEETGSSITNPASASSLVGVRPTFGLIPSAGVFPLVGFRDVVGPLAKTVKDAATMMDVLAGPTTLDPKTLVSEGKLPEGGYAANLTLGALSGARIAVYGPGWNSTTLDTQTQELFERELDVLESLGATLIDDPFAGSDFETLRGENPGGSTFGYDIARYLERLGPGAAFNSVEEYEALTGLDWYDIDRMPNESSAAEPTARPELDEYFGWRADLRAAFDDIMESFDLDAIFMPQLASPVPTLESGDGIRRTPGSAVNILGIPGVVVPGGYYEDGTPFASYFVGQQWDEMLLLNLAYDYEQATLLRIAPLLVPEPATALLIATGLGLFAARRRLAA